MRKIQFIFFLLWIGTNCFAQQSKIDSLFNVLKTSKEDTSKVNTLNVLSGKLWRMSDYKNALQYAKDALSLSKKISFQKGVANAHDNLGYITSNQGNYPEALIYHSASLKIFKQISDKRGVASSYVSIGTIYWYQGNYPEALKKYLQALKIYEEIGNKFGIANSYSGIGLIYASQNNYSEALKNLLLALKIQEEINDKSRMADTYNNLGNIYKALGNNSESVKNLLASLKIQKELGNKYGIAAVSANIGIIYAEQGNYLEALKYHFSASKVQEEIGDKNGMAGSYENIGSVYANQKNFVQAFIYLNKSLMLAKEIGQKNYVMQIYQALAEASVAMGDYKKGYVYHQLYSEVKDSIFNEESSKQIAEMQTKYETEKKEQQIKLLNKDKEIQSKDLERQKTIRNAVAGGLFLVLLFSFVLINRLLLIRKQKKVIEVEREKSEKLLLNILPKDTADELKRNNAVTPKRYDMVTVMFTDFKGFTTIAEKMSAEELVSELDFIFKKFDEIISKYPIEKIKTIGDAYMCAGGLPTPNSTNAMDVVLAALEIQEFMEKLEVGSLQLANEEKKLQTVNWKLRIGVHTGSVIAGVVGDKKFAYDIWGDTVNTASRMESSGEAGKVNISESTYQLVKDNFNCIYRGEVEAKNKGKIKMYFVEKKV